MTESRYIARAVSTPGDATKGTAASVRTSGDVWDLQDTPVRNDVIARALALWPKCRAYNCFLYACRKHMDSYFCEEHIPSGFAPNLPMDVLNVLLANR